jgi:DNA-binding transcriptional ArsR family regulator
MVDVTPRLAQYVEAQDTICCPTLDEQVETLEALESSVSEDALDDEMALLAVLADETRYRILRVLLESDERCVCELDALLEVSDSAISHAMRRLVEAGLADRRKEGRWRIYRATDRAARLVGAVQSEVAE